MKNLNKELTTLRELNEIRTRATELREEALKKIRAIEDLIPSNQTKEKLCEIKSKDNFNGWFASGNEVEAALIVKIQNHRAISSNIEKNSYAEAHSLLKKRLRLQIHNFFYVPREVGGYQLEYHPTVPVLMAARIMQALTNRASTVSSMTSVFCYYRIIRELYSAGKPDFAFGAARAGAGGPTSAFVTGECIRSVFGLEDTVKATVEYLKQTLEFYKRFKLIKLMLSQVGSDCLTVKGNKEDHPLYKWANREIERSALDYILSTEVSNRDICLFYGENSNKLLEYLNGKNLKIGYRLSKNVKKGQKKSEFDEFQELEEKETASINKLVLATKNYEEFISLDFIKNYFTNLPKYILCSLTIAKHRLFLAQEEVYEYREEENPFDRKDEKSRELKLKSSIRRRKSNNSYKMVNFKLDNNSTDTREIIEHYQRTESAHLFAWSIITDGFKQASEIETKIKNILENEEIEEYSERSTDKLELILERLLDDFEKTARRIHRIIEPTKRYIRTVIDRELSAEHTFDAGELVFAATAYGTMNNWKPNDRLKRACNKLVKSFPRSGRLFTKRPLHALQNGYKLIPIGSEMTRCLAQLLNKTNYEVSPETVSLMLNLFEEKEKNQSGWNFDGSPAPDRPCVWVTAISVLALDRIIRLLNNRINNSVLKHFNVIRPEKPHNNLTLNKLIFSDYGFSHEFYNNFQDFYGKNFSTPIILERMRAHIQRTLLPKKYNPENKIFSAIVYGPPGTGKTSLAEALALTSNVPLINLSPSDLVIQGQELIEGRARDVFEALSMLTQAVIIFDEFEPVLKRRGKDLADQETAKNLKNQSMNNSEQVTGEYDSPPSDVVVPNNQQEFIFHAMQTINSLALTDSNETNNQMGRVADKLEDIVTELEKGDSKLKFLMNGMLPKLIKLNEISEKQALVYILATNYFNEIDEAAKRKGRFDLKIPVYNPCPISRAGIFLLKLTEYGKKKGEIFDFINHKDQIRRFINVVASTVNIPVSELAKNSFKAGKDNSGSSVLFDYVLNGTPQPPKADWEKLKGELQNKTNLEKQEIIERNWLVEYETAHSDALFNNNSQNLPGLLVDYLNGVVS